MEKPKKGKGKGLLKFRFPKKCSPTQYNVHYNKHTIESSIIY